MTSKVILNLGSWGLLTKESTNQFDRLFSTIWTVVGRFCPESLKFLVFRMFVNFWVQVI